MVSLHHHDAVVKRDMGDGLLVLGYDDRLDKGGELGYRRCVEAQWLGLGRGPCINATFHRYNIPKQISTRDKSTWFWICRKCGHKIATRYDEKAGQIDELPFNELPK